MTAPWWYAIRRHKGTGDVEYLREPNMARRRFKSLAAAVGTGRTASLGEWF